MKIILSFLIFPILFFLLSLPILEFTPLYLIGEGDAAWQIAREIFNSTHVFSALNVYNLGSAPFIALFFPWFKDHSLEHYKMFMWAVNSFILGHLLWVGSLWIKEKSQLLMYSFIFLVLCFSPPFIVALLRFKWHVYALWGTALFFQTLYLCITPI
jgi:hypothetical protein